MRIRVRLVYLSILFWSVSALPATHYIIFDPGAGADWNSRSFYNDVRYGYEKLRSLGYTPRVFAKNGKWIISDSVTEQKNGIKLSTYSLTPAARQAGDPNTQKIPVYPTVSGPAKNLSDFRTDLQSASRNLGPGDNLVIFISGHGDSGDANKPETATISAWQDEVSYDQFSNVLRQMPKSVKIKIIDTACFGGGVHVISRELNNVCSASTTNFFTEDMGGIDHSSFSSAVWQTVARDNGHASLADAALAGFAAKEDDNPDQGELSSFDYVDFILKTGPYDPHAQKYKHVDTDGGEEVDPWMKSSLPSENKIMTAAQITPNGIYVDCHCGDDLVQTDLERLSEFAQTWHDILSATGENSEINKHPNGLRSVFDVVVNDMKKNGALYETDAELYERSYKEIHEGFESDLKKARQWSWPPVLAALGSLFASYSRAQAKVDKLIKKEEADPVMKRYSFDHHMLQFLDRLQKFDKVATPAQKRKFVELLQCEWEPL